MWVEVLASGSKGNCYKVSNGESTLLLECGIPYREIQKKLNFQTSEIDACFVTHEHLDHAKAVKDLLRAGVDVYMTAGTKEALGADDFRVKIFKRGWNSENCYQYVRVGDFVVRPFGTIHDAK